jgi:hypothetical protein
MRLHFWRSGQLEPLSELSQARIEQAAKVARALRYALMVLFQNGPDRSEFKAGDPSSSRRADLFVKQFEAVVDRSFFELLFAEFEIDGDEAKRRERARWLASLRDQATDLLKAAESGAPSSSIRHYSAWVRAERALRGCQRSGSPRRGVSLPQDSPGGAVPAPLTSIETTHFIGEPLANPCAEARRDVTDEPWSCHGPG